MEILFDAEEKKRSTGILSIFAAKAGAKHVYAIEFAEIAIFAREIIKKNNL